MADIVNFSSGGLPANGTPELSALVLLVDDQPIVGEAVRRLLSGEPDIALHYCADGEAAVALATALRPTIILQDLILPDIDGLEIVRRLRANSATATTPVVVLSTKEDPEVKSRAFAAGANDYIVKLPDRAELVARIRYHSRAYLAQVQRDEAFHALRESQQQLLESNTSLVALNQKLNEFLGMAAHDLRNPLGIVLSFAKFLLRDSAADYSPKQLKFLNTIQSSAEFMLRLVNDLLDVSKIEAGKLTLNCAPTDVASLIQSNVILNRILADEKQIDILVSAEANLPLVSADAHQIEQVLNNLLTNAIKFSHLGRAVTVEVRHVGHEVLVSVHDQGREFRQMSCTGCSSRLA